MLQDGTAKELETKSFVILHSPIKALRFLLTTVGQSGNSERREPCLKIHVIHIGDN